MFDPGIPIGSVLTEDEVHKTFECQTTFGIRMSKKNNLFVIMSGSAKKKIYDDRWIGNVLYYNGTDCNSDSADNQTLKSGKGNNNSQLYQVWFTEKSKRPQIFLFVKKVANCCVYKGEVELDAKPYLEPRHDNPQRSVWIFPLRLKSVNLHNNNDLFRDQELVAQKLDMEETKKIATSHSLAQPLEATRTHRAFTTTYERDPYISSYAKLRAGGVCYLCGNSSPFTDKNGEPYLEEHHIEWLSRGGADSITNVVALCPNCHRKMHVVDDQRDVKTLLSRIYYYHESI